MPGEIDYSQTLHLDLGTVAPSLAGPKRPQDRIEIGKVASTFRELFSQPVAQNGFNQPAETLLTRQLVKRTDEALTRETPDNPPTPLAAPRCWLC